MKTPPPHKKSGQPDEREGAPESRQSNETFPRRTAPPGSVGLANESRPGLGGRQKQPFPGAPEEQAKPADPATAKGNVAQRQRSSREPNDQPLPREPREQRPDTWAHEAERSTGASGQSGL